MYKNVLDGNNQVIDNLYCDGNGEYKRIEYKVCNYVLKLNGDKVDLYYYPNKFQTPVHSIANEICQDFRVDMDVERCFKRNFERNKKTNFAERKENSTATLQDLRLSIKRGANRAIKSFYDYALANDWEYFCTFTFEDERIRNNNDLLYVSYENFRKQLRLRNHDIKSLTVYEEFKKGGYHLHSLLGNIDLNLKPARNKHTGKFKYNDFGVQIFNCCDWKIGWNTIACINPNSVNEQVVNYMSKYMTKCSPAPPGCKRYFKSNNLDCRETHVDYIDNINEIVTSLNLKKYVPKKQNDRNKREVIYFRNYSNLTADLEVKAEENGSTIRKGMVLRIDILFSPLLILA